MALSQRRKRRIDPSLLAMFGILAVVVAVVAAREGTRGLLDGLEGSWRLLQRAAPVTLLGMTLAGTMQVLVPPGLVGRYMGEGSGIVILEELEHAKARGAKIYAEVAGYGLSGDAHHITAPAPDGDGGYRSMKAALKRAELNPEEIDYVNAHGTSTPLGDEIEVAAVKRLFGEAAYQISMSSTKSAIGHLLGAAGSVEAIFSILAMNHNMAPATLNLDDPSDGLDIDLVPHTPKERPIRAALSNSFGFGGTNASLVLTSGV